MLGLRSIIVLLVLSNSKSVTGLDPPPTQSLSCRPEIRNGTALYRHARQAGSRLLIRQALLATQHAISVCSNSSSSLQAEAHFYAGMAHRLAGEHAAATKHLRESLANGSSRTSLLNLAASFASQQLYYNAALTYKALASVTSSAHTLAQAAKMLMRAGQVREGGTCFHEAIHEAHVRYQGTERYLLLSELHYELARHIELYGTSNPGTHILSNFSAATSFGMAACGYRLGSSEAVDTIPVLEDLHIVIHDNMLIMGNDALLVSNALPPMPPAMPLVTPPAANNVSTHGTLRLAASEFVGQTPLHINLMSAVDLAAAVSRVQTHEVVFMGAQLFAVGYYHFLLDVLPRLLLARALFPGVDIVLPANSGRLHRYMDELLKFFDIAHNIVFLNVQASPPPLLHAKRVIHTIKHGAHSNPHRPTAPTTWLLHQAIASRLPQQAARRRLLWISRRAAATRRLAGEQSFLKALRQVLERRGWELRVLADSPPPAPAPTFYAFRGAGMVVGVHGAGLANTVACVPGTIVLELGLLQPHASYFRDVAAILGLEYLHITSNLTRAYGQRYVSFDHSTVLDLINRHLY